MQEFYYQEVVVYWGLMCWLATTCPQSYLRPRICLMPFGINYRERCIILLHISLFVLLGTLWCLRALKNNVLHFTAPPKDSVQPAWHSGCYYTSDSAKGWEWEGWK